MIKEEFKYLSDTEFIPLKDGINSSFIDKYEINKLGQIRIKSTKRILNIITNPKLVDYPKVILRSKEIKEKRYAIHRLLAITFLVNSDTYNKKEVDHIDRNKFNYSLDNLRWVNSSENKLNRSPYHKNKKTYILIVSKISNKIIKILTEDSLSNYTKEFENKDYSVFKINRELFELYSSKSEESLNKELWKKHPTFNIYVSSFGVIKTSSGYSIGHLIQSGYRVINLNGKQKRIHHLVVETFLLGRLLNSNEVVDHLSTIRTDNSLENLSVVTQKENMNNPITKKKFSKEVMQFSKDGVFLRKFSTISKAYEFLGLNKLTSSGISKCCKGFIDLYKGYKWSYVN